MTRWKAEIHPKPPPEPPDINPMIADLKPVATEVDGITDDPLAALGLVETSGSGGEKRLYGKKLKKTVYAVSSNAPRMHLPRVSLKNGTVGMMDNGGGSDNFQNGGDGQNFFLRRGVGINPLYQLTESSSNSPTPSPKSKKKNDRYSSRRSSSFDKTGSSGYSGSNEENFLEPGYLAEDQLKLVSADDIIGNLVERDPNYVKSIRIAGRGLRASKSVPSHSSSSGGGTLSTIPEGKVDLPIPQSIWPLSDNDINGGRNWFNQCDSLVDDALLLYTSLNYVPENGGDKYFENGGLAHGSIRDLLVDLLNSINHTLESRSTSPEEMLTIINEKIKTKLEVLRNVAEEDMKKLCVNMRNSRNINSVLRAFSNSSSSGRSTSSCRARTSSSNEDDFYHIPSNSSSSGFSDSPRRYNKYRDRKNNNFRSFRETRKVERVKKIETKDLKSKTESLSQLSAIDLLNKKPSFVHDDLDNLSKGVRNALIYGTLSRNKIPDISAHNSPIINNVSKQASGKSELELDNTSANKPREFLSESAKTYLKQTQQQRQTICDTKNNKDNIYVVMENDAKGEEGKRRLLGSNADQRPSVWEQYYGVKAEGTKAYGTGKPTDVPVYEHSATDMMMQMKDEGQYY